MIDNIPFTYFDLKKKEVGVCRLRIFFSSKIFPFLCLHLVIVIVIILMVNIYMQLKICQNRF